MRVRGKRQFRIIVNRVVSLVILALCIGLFPQSFQQIKSAFSVVKLPTFAQESPKVLQETQEKPVTPSAVIQKASVLAAASGKGKCGQAWTWPCDDSKKEGYLVNGKEVNRAGNTIKFDSILFRKEPPGLEIGDGVGTTETVVIDDKGTDDPRDDVKKKIGFCLTSGEQFESLAMINLSQPLLPKTIQGLNVSIKPIDADKKEYAGIDLDWLSKLQPEQFEQLFCSMEKTSAEYLLRSMDTYGMLPSSNQLGADWPSYIMNKCFGRSPTETGSKFTEEWKDDEDRDTATFKVLIENNEFHNEVKEQFQKKMLKSGFSGIIDPGAPYLGGYAFQPKSQDTYLVKLAGSAISSQNLANRLITAPKKTTQDLLENKDSIDEKPAGEDSTTLLSVADGKTQDEFERATVESAIFGGIYYIPDSEIEKGGNPSMLSYDPNKLDPKKYLCDEGSGNSSCPIVRATSGCSGLASAKVGVRLRQIVLSAVNDTSQYAATTGGGDSGDTEIPRSYTRAGEFFQGQYRSPQTSIKRATLDELIVISGKGTPKCMEYANGRVSQQSETKLTDVDIENIKKASEPQDFTMQQILVSPINVKYRTWALYKRDLGILAQWGLAKLFGPDPEWAADEVSGEVIRPALISFKADTLYRGQNNTAPGSDDSIDVEKNVNAYLAKQKILPMADAHIDCMTGPYGTAEYWLCSDSKNILPQCQ